jgi:hypothetical protein
VGGYVEDSITDLIYVETPLIDPALMTSLIIMALTVVILSIFISKRTLIKK